MNEGRSQLIIQTTITLHLTIQSFNHSLNENVFHRPGLQKKHRINNHRKHDVIFLIRNSKSLIQSKRSEQSQNSSGHFQKTIDTKSMNKVVKCLVITNILRSECSFWKAFKKLQTTSQKSEVNKKEKKKQTC